MTWQGSLVNGLESTTNLEGSGDPTTLAVLPLEGEPTASTHRRPSVSNLNEEANKYPDYHAQPRSSSPQRGRLLGIPEYHAPRLNIAGRSYNYEEKYPPDAPLAEADEDARVWKVYLDEADVFDHDMIRGFRDTTDSLLVFAALFSAIVTTLVVETSGALQPDHAQIISYLLTEQIAVLRANGNTTLINGVPASRYNPGSVTHSSADVWVNMLFFISLALSIAVALASVLIKQWLQAYTSVISGTAKDRALIRHFRFTGLAKWKLNEIIEALPLVLHSSLAVFAVGLLIFVHSRKPLISWVLLAFISMIAALYTVSLSLPAFFPECPYRISLLEAPTRFIAWVFRLAQHWTRVCLEVTGQYVRGRHYSQPLDKVGSESPELSLGSFWIEEEKALEDVLNIFDAVSWLHSISTNPSVQLIAAVSLASLIPGPTTHDFENDAWYCNWSPSIEKSNKQGKQVIELLDGLYDTLWSAFVKIPIKSYTFPSVIQDHHAGGYSAVARAEALLRSWILHFGDTDAKQGMARLRTETLIDAIHDDTEEVDGNRKGLVDLILKSSKAIFPWERGGLPLSFLWGNWVPSHEKDLGICESDPLGYGQPTHYLAEQWDAQDQLALVLEMGGDVTATTADTTRATPLHLACESCNLEGVQIICKHQHDLNIRDGHNLTAFQVALRKGYFHIVWFFLKDLQYEVDLDEAVPFVNGDYRREKTDSNGMRCIRALGFENTIHYNQDGRSIAAQCEGQTILHIACIFGMTKLVEWLLQRGASARTVDAGGNRPIDLAELVGAEEIVRILLLHELPSWSGEQ